MRITDGALVDASGERGGTILVEAGTVTLADQATLRSSTSGAGQGGDVVIKADDLALSRGSAIISSTDPGSSGTAGHVRVEARTAAIRDGSVIALRKAMGAVATSPCAPTLTIEGFDSQLVRDAGRQCAGQCGWTPGPGVRDGRALRGAMGAVATSQCTLTPSRWMALAVKWWPRRREAEVTPATCGWKPGP